MFLKPFLSLLLVFSLVLSPVYSLTKEEAGQLKTFLKEYQEQEQNYKKIQKNLQTQINDLRNGLNQEQKMNELKTIVIFGLGITILIEAGIIALFYLAK